MSHIFICSSGLEGRVGYSSAGAHRFESQRDAHFHMDNIYVFRSECFGP